MQGTEHDTAFFLALGCAADFWVLCRRCSHQKSLNKQGGTLAFFWYGASGSHTQNIKKNKTKCPPFFLTFPASKLSFFSRFWCHFPPGGTPGAFRAPFLPGWDPRSIFLMIFRCPWGGFGAPFGSFGLPWGALGSHLGARSGAKSVKKSIPGAQCVPEASLGVKREGPGPS